MTTIKTAEKLLGRLSRSNQEFGSAISDYSHADHHAGVVAEAVRNDQRINAESGEACVARAEREAGLNLKEMTDVMDDSVWGRQNSAALQACLDAGLYFHGRQNDLHHPGHMLHTIREFTGLRCIYRHHSEDMDSRIEAMADEVRAMGIEVYL